MEIEWGGPYGWPQFENDLPHIPKLPGVYLLTVEYQDGYLVYAAGITRRPIPERLREHTYAYLNGIYNVLDITAMQQCVRKEIWHGFWMKKRSPEKQLEYEKQRIAINDAVRDQLAGFRIFTSNVGIQPRILERLEASIMENLYKQPAPFSDIPDRGVMLAPRWKTETPIIVNNRCPGILYGLPALLEI